MPKKGTPMSPETKALLRQKALARLADQHSQPVEPETEAETAMVDIIVAENVPTQGKSLKERFSGLFATKEAETGDKTAHKKKPLSKKDQDLLLSFVPLLSGLLANYTRAKTPRDYREVAPRQDEIAAILLPIFAIVNRRISITGTLSPDAMDLLASGTAAAAYASRAYVTFVDLQEQDHSHAATNQSLSGSASRTNQRESRGAARPDLRYDLPEQQEPQSRSECLPQSIAKISPEQFENDTEYARALVSKARTRDFKYRSERGLL